MADTSKPAGYWEERFRRYGHTGWTDKLIYDYDQPLRLKAIDKALTRTKVAVNSTTHVLDIGCGTGDLVQEFARKGAEVIGIDVSQEVIEYAKQRLIDYPNVKLYTHRVEEANFTSECFDLITSITVLQHIISDDDFEKAIDNIVRMVKPGANILILETSPIRRTATKHSVSYFCIRTRREWIEAFHSRGCLLTCELGLPQVGIRLLELYNRILKLLLAPVLSKRASRSPYLDDAAPQTVERRGMLKTIYDVSQRITLKMTRFIDSVLIPFPKPFTNLRILIFIRVP